MPGKEGKRPRGRPSAYTLAAVEAIRNAGGITPELLAMAEPSWYPGAVVDDWRPDTHDEWRRLNAEQRTFAPY